MFDLSFSELLVVGVVALIVIGPKELPGLFRSAGRFTAKLRAMAREFSRAMESAADETGLKEVARDLKAVTSPRAMGLDAVNEAARKFEKWDPLKPAAKPAAKPVAAAAVTAAAAAESAPAAIPTPASPGASAAATPDAVPAAAAQEPPA